MSQKPLKTLRNRPMDALEYRVWHALREIMKNTYGKYLLPFDVEYKTKESRTFHGKCYYAHDGIICHIELANPYRKLSDLIVTAIHELAHHCDYCVSGGHPHGHGKEFYNEYSKLIVTACHMGIIKESNINAGFHADSRDHNKILKAIAGKNLRLIPELEYGKDLTLFKTFPDYESRNYVKDLGFRFNPRNKSWEKILNVKDIKKYTNYLNIVKIKHETASLLDIQLRAHIFVEGETYQYKDALKLKGYHFDQKRKVWNKYAFSDTVKEEKSWLDLLCQQSRITYKVIYS